MPYINALYIADIPSLVDRREQLSRVFFQVDPTAVILLVSYPPPARDLATVTRLRAASKFPRIPTRSFTVVSRDNLYSDPSLPPVLPAFGLSDKRQSYLYDKIRQFVPEDSKDLLCPLPAQMVHLDPEQQQQQDHGSIETGT